MDNYEQKYYKLLGKYEQLNDTRYIELINADRTITHIIQAQQNEEHRRAVERFGTIKGRIEANK